MTPVCERCGAELVPFGDPDAEGMVQMICPASPICPDPKTKRVELASAGTIKDVLDWFKDQPPDSISDAELERIYAEALAAGVVTEPDLRASWERFLELPVAWTASGTLVLDKARR